MWRQARSSSGPQVLDKHQGYYPGWDAATEDTAEHPPVAKKTVNSPKGNSGEEQHLQERALPVSAGSSGIKGAGDVS